MANPQKENGSTDIANELLESIYNAKFNGTELAIILCVLRYTYGFHRKDHELSISFIAKAIDRHKHEVSKYVKKLVDEHVLIEYEKPSFSSVRQIGINKDYSKWNNYQSVKLLTPSKNTNTTVSKITDRGVSKITDQETKNEETKNKTKNIYSATYYQNEELNNIFIEYLVIRKKLKAINSDRAIKMLLNKLSRFDDQTKYAMIEQSIVHSWKDIYELKEKVADIPKWFNNQPQKEELTYTEEEQKIYDYIRGNN